MQMVVCRLLNQQNMYATSLPDTYCTEEQQYDGKKFNTSSLGRIA